MYLGLFLFLLFFLMSFLFERLGVIQATKKINEATLKSLLVIREPAFSDHWKEKFLLGNSRKSLLLSLRLGGLILIFLVAVLIPLALYNWLFPGAHVFDYLMTARGIAVSILPFFVFFAIRKYQSSKKR
ncbi:MAG: hypothetical protein H6564_10835 [Lewinellaceae bacterium]|nr:hypothetical protein [Lewinellaceae bacterium]